MPTFYLLDLHRNIGGSTSLTAIVVDQILHWIVCCSIRKRVGSGTYGYAQEDAYSRVVSLTHHIDKLEVGSK